MKKLTITFPNAAEMSDQGIRHVVLKAVKAYVQATPHDRQATCLGNALVGAVVDEPDVAPAEGLTTTEYAALQVQITDLYNRTKAMQAQGNMVAKDVDGMAQQAKTGIEARNRQIEAMVRQINQLAERVDDLEDDEDTRAAVRIDELTRRCTALEKWTHMKD